MYGAIDKYEKNPDGVLSEESDKSLQPVLFPAQPNPVRHQTLVTWSLPTEMPVEINIVDIRGRIIRQLFHGRQAGGKHRLIWNGQDQSGKKVSSGFYLVHLVTKNKVMVQKLTVLR